MGERKGVNKYYPPDFDPAKHVSLNKYRNSHPLRERARKLSQGILIIRFEMPYNIWCDGCKNHIGMGVRYNAEKKKVGNYYTTPIYRFRMKCHLCVNYIEMQTDPANCDYVIVSGAQRKEERWDMQDNEQILTTEHEEKKQLETDAMYRLEHGAMDQSKLQRAIPTLSNIQEAQSAWKDDFAINSMLRRKFREEKKILQEEEEKDLALQTKANLSIPLVQETEEDRRLAALLKYHSLDCTCCLLELWVGAASGLQQEAREPGLLGSVPSVAGRGEWEPGLLGSSPGFAAYRCVIWGWALRRVVFEPGGYEPHKSVCAAQHRCIVLVPGQEP
ncbi:coiled-coil domain-containing protein 130 isoform X2 [Chelonia mydas]|uniref:coiled-coil domain-containing protein 130 isoform X2 n=1 Tax=Chelonia mydas TaxID=8469 RepID=UPI001CA9AC44|nr:coiled-coil domain-containing protein 130 isoform X2 [Chelonia mydas]